MKTEHFNNRVLSDQETVLLLEGFCHEALRFLKVPTELYPKFEIGVLMGSDGKANPIFIDYAKAKVLIFIPIIRMLLAYKVDNDAPTFYRMTGYQIARFWNRFILTEKLEPFNAIDEDSLVFSYALMMLKGIGPSPMMPNAKAIEMLKNEFNINCKLIPAYGKDKTMYPILHLEPSAQKQTQRKWEELSLANINRPLDTIAEGQRGSQSNPFVNVDEAAEFVLKIEQERLKTDPYRQAVFDEQYFYDGVLFRIPWASSHVSYYPINGTPNNCFVVNQLSTHNKFVLKPSLVNNKFLYRGQAEFYPECLPSMFRDKKKDYFVDDMIQMNELECLLKNHPLVQLFEQGFELLHDQFRFKIHYGGLSQHYYNNTSYLDLTSDMEVAKFFAVTTFNMNDDCYEKYSGDKLGVLYYFDLKADSFRYSPHRSYIVDNIGKQPFMRSGNQSGFLVSMDKGDDFNTYPDVRYVFFRHDSAITDRIFAQYDNGNKIMPDEILRKHWYARMSDEKAKKIVSTDALKLNFANNPHESHNKIRKALQQKGFKIKSYHPCFTSEELDVYYQTAPEFWEEFCSNIYFYSPEGALMKEHLRNLPNDPRYRWAFYK